MSRAGFQVRVDDEGILWLAGELDMAEAERFFQTAVAHLHGRRDAVLECSALTFLDSSGVLAILKLASESSKAVVIRNPCPPVSTVLTIAGVDGVLGVRVEPPIR